MHQSFNVPCINAASVAYYPLLPTAILKFVCLIYQKWHNVMKEVQVKRADTIETFLLANWFRHVVKCL